MRRASVTEAKNGLSALLDRVRHGETIVIEDRGVAVAMIAPVARIADGLDGDRLAALERRGVIRRSSSSKASATLLAKPPRPKRPVVLSRLVSDERGRGW